MMTTSDENKRKGPKKAMLRWLVGISLTMLGILQFCFLIKFLSPLSNTSKQALEELQNEKKAWEQQREALQAELEQSKQACETSDVVKDTTTPSISEIMQKTGTDKYFVHHYERSYDKWLAPFRDRKGLKMLEIGANTGESMALWAEYFSEPALILALAYGKPATGVDSKIDTQGFASRNQDKLKILWGDQSQKETMDALCKEGPFDIIVDDGSHVPSHMIFSMVHLIPCLVPGGLYIIEDVETNYWDKNPEVYGYKLPGVGIGVSPRYSAIEKLKQLLDVMNRYEICRDDLSVLPGDENVCEMAFSSNVVKITLCKEEEKDVRKAACINWKAKRVNQEKVTAWMEAAKSTNIDLV